MSNLNDGTFKKFQSFVDPNTQNVDIIKNYAQYKIITGVGTNTFYNYDNPSGLTFSSTNPGTAMISNKTVTLTQATNRPTGTPRQKQMYNIFKTLILPSSRSNRSTGITGFFENQNDDITIISFNRQDVHDRISTDSFQLKLGATDYKLQGFQLLKGVPAGKIVQAVGGTSGQAIGYVIYSRGFIILKGFLTTTKLTKLKMNVQMKVNSELFFVRIKNTQFNYSSNPTFINPVTGQIRPYINLDNPTTYITGIGLYDDSNNLLAVAKLSKPIQKTMVQELTFRVKIQV